MLECHRAKSNFVALLGLAADASAFLVLLTLVGEPILDLLECTTNDNSEENHPRFGWVHCDLIIHHAKDEELVVINGGVV